MISLGLLNIRSLPSYFQTKSISTPRDKSLTLFQAYSVRLGADNGTCFKSQQLQRAGRVTRVRAGLSDQI